MSEPKRSEVKRINIIEEGERDITIPFSRAYRTAAERFQVVNGQPGFEFSEFAGEGSCIAVLFLSATRYGGEGKIHTVYEFDAWLEKAE